jgi:hypothetical protein
MKASWEAFSSEVAGELKSICAILGAPPAGDGSTGLAAPRWEDLPVGKLDCGRSPEEDAAPPVEPRPQVRRAVREELKVSPPKVAPKVPAPPDPSGGSRANDALKGHDRIAALKERLAEKLRCESERRPKENPCGEVAFARAEEEP